MLKHSMWVFAAVVCAAFSPQPVMAQTKALDMAPATIRFGYITGLAFPTFIVSEERGFFRKESLNVEKVFLAGSGPVSEALAAGNLDLGNTTPLSSVLATAKGAKTLMVSGYEYTFIDKAGHSWEAVYAVVRSGEGIKRIADMRGKRIAINDIGSSYTYMMREQLMAAGLNPDKDVTLTFIPFAQMAGALIQKQVDVILASPDGYQLARERAKVDVIGTHTTLERVDIGLSSAIGVNSDFLRKNPDVVTRFLRAFLQARLWMNEQMGKNSTEVLDIVSKSMKYTPERAKAFWETRGGYYGRELPFVNVLDIPRRLIVRQLAILRTSGMIKLDTSNEYSTYVDIRPLLRAYETLGVKWDESKH
ncbi:MAG: ABC transporter substrate-binding protein [Acidobacteriia bacterium]|nr:ABC transporter substrate-binding protein [Terriglobia bacterium]